MHINRITINNFRLLQNSTLDLEDKRLSLLIGKNNTGKTSLIVLFERFFHQENKFNYNDFSMTLRKEINDFSDLTKVADLSIRMILEIEYDENDNLENLSDFILDLDPDIKTVKILFECTIDKEGLLRKIKNSEGEERKKLIIQNLGMYLKKSIYSIDDDKNIDSFAKRVVNLFLFLSPKNDQDTLFGNEPELKKTLAQYQENNDLNPEDAVNAFNNLLAFIKKINPSLSIDPISTNSTPEDQGNILSAFIKELEENNTYPLVLKKNQNIQRGRLVEKKLQDVKKLINLQIIHARRNVVSSEEGSTNKKPLSVLTTDFFDSESENENDISNEYITKINQDLAKMDGELNKSYESFFEGFMSKSKEFLDLPNLNVRSNIQSKTLLKNSSHVIYGEDNNHLPENLNGLGHMNILYLLLTIEIKKAEINKENKDINLLFIEEPEAHTHPQMQYIFAEKIEEILNDIKNLQTLVTSHSPHIVLRSNFENIRYLKLTHDNNVEIKNFHTELKKKYSSESENFQFLKQYLNIQSAELFFANKVIFIEGITECILLPYFIKQIDDENKAKDKKYKPLASQNISILEVGTNAKAFAKFLEFLDIKTLIITDIDTTEPKISEKNTIKYKACEVKSDQCSNTSNSTLMHFFNAPEISDEGFKDWFNDLVKNKLECKYKNIKISYQTEENSYHARSFEDAFVNLNLNEIKRNKKKLWGIKSKGSLEKEINMYKLTNKILDKKSDFASSLLFMALSKQDDNTEDNVQWKIPLYIKEGLKWIAEQ
ncbi:MAG: ATP-dependent endonuclease [Pseudomonadota bacterium]